MSAPSPFSQLEPRRPGRLLGVACRKLNEIWETRVRFALPVSWVSLSLSSECSKMKLPPTADSRRKKRAVALGLRQCPLLTPWAFVLREYYSYNSEVYRFVLWRVLSSTFHKSHRRICTNGNKCHLQFFGRSIFLYIMVKQTLEYFFGYFVRGMFLNTHCKQ